MERPRAHAASSSGSFAVSSVGATFTLPLKGSPSICIAMLLLCVSALACTVLIKPGWGVVVPLGALACAMWIARKCARGRYSALRLSPDGECELHLHSGTVLRLQLIAARRLSLCIAVTGITVGSGRVCRHVIAADEFLRATDERRFRRWLAVYFRSVGQNSGANAGAGQSVLPSRSTRGNPG